MVRKLVKYDFMSFFRLLFPVQLILLGIALINRMIQFFETKDSVAYESAFTSSIVLLVIACIAALVMTVILSIVRFYQGLYSSEGYLSHTLPVTESQHIFSKLLVSMLFVLGTLFSIFLSVCVATFGEVNIELFKAAGFLFGKLFTETGVHGAFFILELLLTALFYAANILLVFYFCISIGQLAPRKKILLAFGVFFGLYALMQITSTVMVIVFSVNPEILDKLMEMIKEIFEKRQYLGMHLVFIIPMAAEMIVSVIFFFINRLIMKKKLNLA